MKNTICKAQTVVKAVMVFENRAMAFNLMKVVKVAF